MLEQVGRVKRHVMHPVFNLHADLVVIQRERCSVAFSASVAVLQQALPFVLMRNVFFVEHVRVGEMVIP